MNVYFCRQKIKIKASKRMGKLTDHELAKFISKRVTELTEVTGLPLKGLASFTGISYSTLRSAKNESLSLSLDSFARLCSPFSIHLSDFFNPEIKLTVDGNRLPEIVKFKEAFLDRANSFKSFEMSVSPSRGINDELRKQREFVARMIYTSDYFHTEKTLNQMVLDFEREHQIQFSKDRLTVLLKKYIGLELLDKKVLPRTIRRPNDLRRPYLYFRKSIPNF